MKNYKLSEVPECITRVQISLSRRGKWSVKEAWLQQVVATALQTIGSWRDSIGLTIGVHLTTQYEMRRYNREYRGKDEATNVLAFPYLDYEEINSFIYTWFVVPPPFEKSSFVSLKVFPFRNNAILGDLILAYEVVAEEARAQHKKLLEHCAHLVVHGTLHLLGYVHEMEKDAEIMESLEITTMKKLGFDNPYRPVTSVV